MNIIISTWYDKLSTVGFFKNSKNILEDRKTIIEVSSNFLSENNDLLLVLNFK